MLCTKFSVLDVNSSFWQIQFDEQSAKLCTFSSHLGDIIIFKRLPFRLSSSEDIFKRECLVSFRILKVLKSLLTVSLCGGITTESLTRERLDMRVGPCA